MADRAGRVPRVGILTFFEANNCGANLQALALTEAVEELGCDCEIVRYAKEPLRKAPIVHAKKNTLQSRMAAAVLTLLRRRRKAKFVEFRRKYMKISDRQYIGAEISEANARYNVFITGSDQVWNYSLSGSDDTYFLDFVVPPVRKCSYAPSFGTYRGYSPEVLARIKEELSDFYAISVRENEGVEMVREIAGREATRVPDPVFLRTTQRWMELAEPKTQKRPFVFLYAIKSPRPAMLELIRRICAKRKWDVIVYQKQLRRQIAGKYVSTLDPREFLGYLRDAQMVLTDSYHGTVFSILFHKNFWSFRGTYQNTRDARIEEVLQIYGLEDRLVDAELPPDPFLQANHSDTDQTVQVERERGLKFLREICKDLF